MKAIELIIGRLQLYYTNMENGIFISINTTFIKLKKHCIKSKILLYSKLRKTILFIF